MYPAKSYGLPTGDDSFSLSKRDQETSSIESLHDTRETEVTSPSSPKAAHSPDTPKDSNKRLSDAGSLQRGLSSQIAVPKIVQEVDELVGDIQKLHKEAEDHIKKKGVSEKKQELSPVPVKEEILSPEPVKAGTASAASTTPFTLPKAKKEKFGFDLSDKTRAGILGSASKRVALSTLGALVRVPMGAARLASSPAIAITGAMVLCAGAVIRGAGAGPTGKNIELEGLKILKFAGLEAVSGTTQPLTSVVEVLGSTIGLIVDPIIGKETVRTASLHLESKVTSPLFYYAAAASSDLRSNRRIGKKQTAYMRIMNKITLLNPNMGEGQKTQDIKGPSKEYIRAAEHAQKVVNQAVFR